LTEAGGDGRLPGDGRRAPAWLERHETRNRWRLNAVEVRFHGVRGAPPREVSVLIGDQLPHQIRRHLDLGGRPSAHQRSVRLHAG
jgi:hypothetical protein